MKYPDGSEVHIGDRIKLWKGCEGRVVCSIDSGEYSDEYTKEDWAYLQNGVLIETNMAGLIHYLQFEPEVQLVERQGTDSEIR